MEVFLYNSTVCRLCGEENDNGTLLYSCEENNQSLCEIINAYLPIKVSDDGELPRTICPGCTIQLEATVEFLNLIISGQKILRELYQREKEYKKSVLSSATKQVTEVISEKIIYEINTSNGVYQVEHPISLQVSGLDKPKRKRGRPPKKHKSPEELDQEIVKPESEARYEKEDEERSGKRRRKTPTRFREAVQGKELERIFIEEGVIDDIESDQNSKADMIQENKVPVNKEPQVIGHLEASGELVVVVKGKGRGRPKGRMRQRREECAICGMEFSSTGRYMSHIAQHGPVLYKCGCGETFPTKLLFSEHQKISEHTGRTIVPHRNDVELSKNMDTHETKFDIAANTPCDSSDGTGGLQIPRALPDLSDIDPLKCDENEIEIVKSEEVENGMEPERNNRENAGAGAPSTDGDRLNDTKGKVKIKCNHCDKTFSNRQSKSLHIKAAHLGERSYSCAECGACFSYPRSLALHRLAHRRARPHAGYACDLCGKVLNHPSSVVYHKQAEHAEQRYVCGACGKHFRHKQLLQRHQLVHSQARPFTCKVCTATFKTKANLLNHHLLHSGVKKFSCEICKHRFAHKTSLTLHMRWHTGELARGAPSSSRLDRSDALAPRRREALHLRRVRQELQPEGQPVGARAHPHGREALPVRALPEALHHLLAAPSARAEALRASARLRPLRQAHVLPQRVGGACEARRLRAAESPQEQGPQTNKPASERQEPTTDTTGRTQAFRRRNERREGYIRRLRHRRFQLARVSYTGSGTEENKVVTTCELYARPSLLVPQPVQQLQLESVSECPQLEEEHLEIQDQPLELEDEQVQLENHLNLVQEKIEEIEEEESEQGVIGGESIPVTDERGNPLHFTMADGTKLAITSIDGKSLQVITQDGQTIPVEINGYDDEEESSSSPAVHQLTLQKTAETNNTAPVTHYFTIV